MRGGHLEGGSESQKRDAQVLFHGVQVMLRAPLKEKSKNSLPNGIRSVHVPDSGAEGSRLPVEISRSGERLAQPLVQMNQVGWRSNASGVCGPFQVGGPRKDVIAVTFLAGKSNDFSEFGF